ncbi:MAG: type II toxin-antitoxin system HipA family toxin [Deltaproteobacteria bacterium]|nr:type II toxin-antitoxin system HipA family toxin [Deltaproteobacteria bacterium]
MGRRRQARTLFVWMNGLPLGQLTREGGRLRFRYDASWLERPEATPLCSALPLSSDTYPDDAVAHFFDNLLPDHEAIRRRMELALDARSARPFDLLEAAGADCVGALSLLPDGVRPDVRRVDARPISPGEIASLLRSSTDQPLGMRRDEEEFRISIAGAQEKTALLWHEGAWHRPHGATPTSHILKPPIGSLGLGLPNMQDSVENEWLCLRVVEAFGLPVARAEIQRFDDAKALVVERFDRQWSRDSSWLMRLPQEDLCQALGVSPARKYESDGGPGIEVVMKLLEAALDPVADRATFMRSQVVFWLLAATDGHAKNFSLRLLPGGRTQLLPLYDVLSAYPAVARGEVGAQKLKLAMAALGKNRHYRWGLIERRHWISTATRCGFSKRAMEALLDECAERIEPVVEQVRAELPAGFDAGVAEPIFQGLRAMKLRLVS